MSASTPPVHIAGVGITRFAKQQELSVKDLAREAVTEALADTGWVGAAYFATAGQGCIEGQHMVVGEIALKAMGITGIPVTNVEDACASSSTALNAARWCVAAGGSDICLVVGVDKLFSTDKEKSIAVFDGAWDVHRVAEQSQALFSLAAQECHEQGSQA
ncbi:beta-ketoacyl synthase N-terminal-like domain-containing protein [Hydrogenophaga electricum]|uniref:Thiolase N-terminal domain-containing protein n=1 Tax=Hydrogenophaga electricum TaxID=1230953 RepID=A0ABQ6BY95_9BURK|nr:beta-ketoacyl synthase N-terminal-like domain-containing protein [Hydrogenophaga electricum]GLS13121.1 hypothetical protein GCM10007935_05500 [Hydrogenophaga electricum]